jgi:hypothetical protein
MTLEPAGEGARLRWAVATPTADGAVMRLMTRAMRPMLRRRLRRNFGDCLAKLREMIEAEAGVEAEAVAAAVGEAAPDRPSRPAASRRPSCAVPVCRTCLRNGGASRSGRCR